MLKRDVLRAFVEDVFCRYRERFGEKRRNGVRKMKGGEWGDLCVVRDLQKQVIS